MSDPEIGRFDIAFADANGATSTVYKDRLLLGRLETCDVVLPDSSVSRVHAAIHFKGLEYSLLNLSAVNPISLNGRPLAPQEADVLTAGDTIQIGPFVVRLSRTDDALSLMIEPPSSIPAKGDESQVESKPSADDVLKVFWEKRNREKEEWGTRLRPTREPVPGKSTFNWSPTTDLRRPWRAAIFFWSLLLLGTGAAYAYLNFPDTYARKPLSSAHAGQFDNSGIAVRPNGNSCTTCHMPDQPLVNSCISCHQGSEFHPSNTKAHEEAGITCTACHREHQGTSYQSKIAAAQSCADCHNDNNKSLYNGNSVRTPHGGTYGYPVADAVWTWKGVFREVADAVPEINSSATGDKDEQARLSRQFHTIHVERLVAPPGTKANAKGLVSCSTCHNTFEPVDRRTPRQTCAQCHGVPVTNVVTVAPGANCISCHVQHPYSTRRWDEFLTADALQRRRDAVLNKIQELSSR